MYKELPKLLMYREFEPDSILVKLSEIIREFDGGEYDKDQLISRIFAEVHRMLEISTDYGFDKNLWHDYIAYVLVTSENPFSLTAERAGMKDGSVNEFAKQDMMIFNHLFNYNFQKMETKLEINCFSTITNYSSIHKRRQVYNKNVSDKVRTLSDAIDANLSEMNDKVNAGELSLAEADAKAAEDTLHLVTDFYKNYGVGMLGLNTAFRIAEIVPGAAEDKKSVDFCLGNGIKCTPIKNTDKVSLNDLVGYEVQKQRLRENTESFLAGNPANNVLLFGDAGTGKSTSIKALINEYYEDGLRMIELYKHQMKLLAPVISSIKNRNYRFIIYMDDLSFEENETEYKYLKAVIEGGLETRPDNVLIYATSNRRNLIRETWNDTNDVELDKHRSDTLQEKLSLVSRFGVTIPYMRPNKKEYEEIVKSLASRNENLQLSEEELLELANKWSVSHGGMSGRAAQQLMDSIR